MTVERFPDMVRQSITGDMGPGDATVSGHREGWPG